MKNKWRFFAVTLAVVLCMTVFSVTAYAGGDMVDSTMGDPTMESSVLPSTSRKRQRVQSARKESCYDEFYQ